MSFDPKTAAVLIVDLQNDFLDPKGAYGRAVQTSSEIAALPSRILPLLKAIRQAGGWVVSTQFTLVPGKDGEPFISNHLKKLRPFLGKGDFTPASWGNSLVDNLQPADITVEKIAYSAFYQTRMEYSLSKAGIKTLFVCGIVTNGGVASTVRDAHVRDFQTITFAEGCAPFSKDSHNLAIQSLQTVGEVTKAPDAISLIN